MTGKTFVLHLPSLEIANIECRLSNLPAQSLAIACLYLVFRIVFLPILILLSQDYQRNCRLFLVQGGHLHQVRLYSSLTHDMADYSHFATPITDWTVLEQNLPEPPAKETIAQLKEVTNASREAVSSAELISQGKLSVYLDGQLSHTLSFQRPSESSRPQRLCHALSPWFPSALAHLSTEVDLDSTQTPNLCSSSRRRLSLWKPRIGRRCLLTHCQDAEREWAPCHGCER